MPRLPQHVGFIPDGNRRWAVANGLPKQDGYAAGIAPGIQLCRQCLKLGIPEVSIYGFTQDNVKRPGAQRTAFSEACIGFATQAEEMGCSVHALGNSGGRAFPSELIRYCSAHTPYAALRINLLVNYGWDWDLDGIRSGMLRSHAVPRLDLIVRWGGGRRLSGFLPAQSVYADFYVVNDYWPDFQPGQFEAALEWYGRQDRTLGG